MREHKFRFWSRPLNALYWFDLAWGNTAKGGGYIGMLPVGETERVRGFSSLTMDIDTGDGEGLMQYTGLEDKNGKDIYEGDIVRIRSQYDTDQPIDSLARVRFNDGSFRCDFHNMILNQAVCDGSYNWNMEVVGNIYEDPELVKGLITPDDSN